MSSRSKPAESVAPLPDRPLVVQRDGTLLLDTDGPSYATVRDFLGGFAQLDRSPERVHTYRLTPLSLWNAAAVGYTLESIAQTLETWSRYPVPAETLALVRDQLSRFGRTRLLPGEHGELVLASADPQVLALAVSDTRTSALVRRRNDGELSVAARDRGALKQAMVHLGYPIEDLCGYVDGAPLKVTLRDRDGHGRPFAMRPYQVAAVETFHDGGGVRGGAGVIVLPCGAGKTVVGIGAIARIGARTLVLTTSTLAARQWIDELLDKTDLPRDAVGEYTGHRKDVRPITVATYQMLTHRPSKDGGFPHLELLRDAGWGLLVYDEVHTLPAPVFRATAELQARRRLGLTATLVREDGREDDVFALIGPKRFEVPWKVLESQRYIAQAFCTEVRVALTDKRRVAYALAPNRDRFRMAAENPAKVALVRALLAVHPTVPALVIGQFLDQLGVLSKALGLSLITGATPESERERLFERFRRGDERALVVSKVANFAIDLPDAGLLVQVSGTFGSRQEEAQRLGRVLRPKAQPSRFYTLVSRDTVEQDFAAKRQLFLVEQGYRYEIVPGEDIETG